VWGVYRGLGGVKRNCNWWGVHWVWGVYRGLGGVKGQL